MSENRLPCPAARRVVDRIAAEHLLLARMIGALQAWVVRCRDPGSRPDHGLFAAMLRYVEEVPNELHHPQEDRILFPALQEVAGASQVIAALEAEHAAGAAMLEALHAAHEALQAGQANALNRLSDAVDDFAEFYWAHMRTEESVLLPMALEALAPSRWEQIDASFVAANDPRSETEIASRYRELQGLITARLSEPLRGYVEEAVARPR